MEDQIKQFVVEMREVEATRRQIDLGFQQVRQSYRAKRKALQERHEALMANILADPAEQSPLFAHAGMVGANPNPPQNHRRPAGTPSRWVTPGPAPAASRKESP